MAQLPTMADHADALHPASDPGAPWGRDAKGRPLAFQDRIQQGSGAPSAPAPKPPPSVGLIDALTPKVRK